MLAHEFNCIWGDMFGDRWCVVAKSNRPKQDASASSSKFGSIRQVAARALKAIGRLKAHYVNKVKQQKRHVVDKPYLQLQGTLNPFEAVAFKKTAAADKKAEKRSKALHAAKQELISLKTVYLSSQFKDAHPSFVLPGPRP